MNFWPFNIAAKRRAAEQAAKELKAERERAYRDYLARTPTKARTIPPATRPTPVNRTAVPTTSRDDTTDISNPLHPFNPLNPISPVSVWASSNHSEPTKQSCDPSPSYESSSCDTGSPSSYD
jgi:hypothetical protein